jgi:glutamine amidotransferase
MCRFLAYTGQPVFLDTLLVHPKLSLVAQSLAAREAKTVVNADGCGVGWYAERSEPGLYRGILPAWSDHNLTSLCHQIKARLAFAHVRSATSGEVATANCHPFAYGESLFMHNGQIGDYDHVRRRVDALIPDSLYPMRRGTSDSEAIFLAAIGRGLAIDPIRALAATLEAIEAEMQRVGTGKPLRFSAVYTDGHTIWAYRWASDDKPPSLYWEQAGAGMVIASEPFDEDLGAWNKVPANSVMIVDAKGGMRIEPFVVKIEPAARVAA